VNDAAAALYANASIRFSLCSCRQLNLLPHLSPATSLFCDALWRRLSVWAQEHASLLQTQALMRIFDRGVLVNLDAALLIPDRDWRGGKAA